jgi:type II secretory ATPase GspE/PulE/Tfp pilus assembly ATPase PilB-like protein
MKKEQTPVITELNLYVDDEALDLLGRRDAMRLQVLPMQVQGDTLVVAMINPNDILKIDEVQRITGKNVRAARADLRVIDRGIQRFYGERDDLETGAALAEPGLVVEADARTGAMLGPGGQDAPAVALINELLETAIFSRASDIHVEAGAAKLQVRFRVDGVLFDHQSYPIDLHPAVLSRIKIMSGMDIGEHRLPQDGRFDARLRGKVFDIRASVVPSIFGETAVLRLLPKTATGLKLVELGFSSDHLRTMEDMVQRPHGMLFATGPTGSGKTTTLYAVLSRLDRIGRNVVTIEDPVEYQLTRATQIQVHPRIGLDFAGGLRSILRQDPDVIMVGEIRDLETLRMAIQSALTGHLVLTTVHCNDAASGAARLIDMGAEPFLVASAATAFLSQRLVRRICPQCRTEDTPKQEMLDSLSIEPGTFYRGRGCDHCGGTGYFGRISVFEIMMVDEEISAAITRRETAGEVRQLARGLGMKGLREDAIDKAREGVTTLEEVLRAVWVDET